MKDITTIPLEELLSDKSASEIDVQDCRAALNIGYLFHKDGTSVQERLDVNIRIINKIENELKRRKQNAEA